MFSYIKWLHQRSLWALCSLYKPVLFILIPYSFRVRRRWSRKPATIFSMDVCIPHWIVGDCVSIVSESIGTIKSVDRQVNEALLPYSVPPDFYDGISLILLHSYSATVVIIMIQSIGYISSMDWISFFFLYCNHKRREQAITQSMNWTLSRDRLLLAAAVFFYCSRWSISILLWANSPLELPRMMRPEADYGVVASVSIKEQYNNGYKFKKLELEEWLSIIYRCSLFSNEEAY